MRKVIVKRGPGASRTKRAMDMGDVAPVVLENFETLTNPKFKPRLELIEGDPHNAPKMNTNTDQNIKTDGEDSKRPSTEEIARGGSDYENAKAPEAEKIPHENEHVKQGAKTADENEKPDFLKTDEEKEAEDSDDSDDSGDKTVEAMQKLKREFAHRYDLATQLFDIRKQAGVEDEINRYNYVNIKAEATEIPALEAQIADGRSYLSQITASQPQRQDTKVAGVQLPGGFTGSTPSNNSPFDDDLDMIVLAG